MKQIMMHISDLVPILAKKYFEKMGDYANKTKLIKLAYLAEVYFKRYTGKRLTDQQWIFWKFGPYFFDYEKIIGEEAVFEKPDRKEDFVPIIVRSDCELKELSGDEAAALLRALDHAAGDLNEILDYVYFETEPMINADKRGETLNFDSVYPTDFYVVKSYKTSPQQSKEIREKVKEWKRKRQYA